MNTILPRNESKEDLNTRLLRMKSYRQWAIEQGLLYHVLAESELKAWLSAAGYDPKLSAKVFP